MSRKAKKFESQIVPLRVPVEMQKRIRFLAAKNHLSDADIMRLAIERGFDAVERMLEPQKQAA